VCSVVVVVVVVVSRERKNRSLKSTSSLYGESSGESCKAHPVTLRGSGNRGTLSPFTFPQWNSWIALLKGKRALFSVPSYISYLPIIEIERERGES